MGQSRAWTPIATGRAAQIWFLDSRDFVVSKEAPAAASLLRASVQRLTPCYAPLLLQIAKRQGVVNPENTFFSVKRFIGRKMDEVKDESKQVGQR